MSEKKTILVTGATGRQGSSVCKHLCQSGNYIVRCFVKKDEMNTEDCKSLEKLGCKIYSGDYMDRDSLKEAMQGVDGAFIITDFWKNPDKPEIEIQEGKNIAEMCKECGVKHVVFSSLEYAKKMVQGKYEVPEFDTKGEIAEYMNNLNLNCTFVNLAFFMENLLGRNKPTKDNDGTFAFILPMGDKPLDLISVEDTGGIVKAIFDNPEKWIGQTIGCAGDSLTGQQIAETFQRVTGKKARHLDMSIEDYEKLNLKWAKQMAQSFRFLRDFSGKLKDLNQTKQLYSNVSSFENWLKKHSAVFA